MNERFKAGSETPLPEGMRSIVPALWSALLAQFGGLDLIKRRGGDSLTYQQVEERSANLARGLLAMGCGKSTRVGILLPNGPDWVVAWLAASRIGALAVTLSTFFSAQELHDVVADADIAVLLTANSYLRHDYMERLETACPGLSMATGPELAVGGWPYLRSIWTTEPAAPAWVSGTIGQLEHLGAESDRFTRDLLAEIEASIAPSDSAMMIYTSGSTARPKGIFHTQGTLVDKICFTARANTLQPTYVERGDRLVASPPFFWVGGFFNFACAMVNGACIICEDDHAPDAMLRAVLEERATHASFTPAMLAKWRGSPQFTPDLLDRMKPINTAQTPLFYPEADTPPGRFSRSMGMTETFGPHAGVLTAGVLPEGMEGSVGHVIGAMEYKLIDPVTGERSPPGAPGELCVRGPWLMEGINKRTREDVFEKDGFYRTGDLCELRPEGYLFFRSRLGGMIKTSGANVSPEEVELAIQQIDGVLDVAVMGVPDARLGQRVVAVVAAAPGAGLDETIIQSGVKKRISAFKVPRRVLFCSSDDMPRTPSNKIRKSVLLEMFAEELGIGATHQK